MSISDAGEGTTKDWLAGRGDLEIPFVSLDRTFCLQYSYFYFIRELHEIHKSQSCNKSLLIKGLVQICDSILVCYKFEDDITITQRMPF